MFKSKKVISILAVLTLGVTSLLGGCQPAPKQNNSDSKVSSSTETTKETPAPSAKEEPIVLELTHVQALTHPYTQMFKDMAADIEKESNGRLVIKDFPASQLGSEQETLDSVANDALGMANTAVDVIGKLYTPAIIVNAPYVFRDSEHQKKFLESDMVTTWWEDVAKETNIRVIGTMYYGARHLSSSKEINKPEDMKGFKLRVPQAPTNLAFANAVGASPTPMAIAEVYLALQQKAIDGQENPVPTVIGQKFYEVQEYLILTGHIEQVTALSISDKKWQQLPDDLKEILLNNVNKLTERSYEEINKSTTAGIEEVKAKGMKVIQPDAAAFKKSGDLAIQELAKEYGSELIDLYEEIQKIQ